MSTIRIGQGFDVHAFGPGDSVTLGGVRIPFSKGIVAHSDGDVVLHALCDALLGALALGDIGHHFPDTDPRWKEADSRVLLRAVMGLVHTHGYRVGNVDLTIMAEAPRIAPWVELMRAEIARGLGTENAAVSVKATTMEKQGFVGRGEGITALAVVLLLAV